jgi:hypothetical protein
MREDPATAGEPHDETWPRSTEPPVSDIDLKRPGKVDRALRARVERGAGPGTPPVNAPESRRAGREEAAAHPAEPDRATAAAHEPTESFTSEPVVSSESDDPSDSG